MGVEIFFKSVTGIECATKCRVMRGHNSLIECGLRLDPALRRIRSLKSFDIQVLGEVSLPSRAYDL